MTYGKAQEKRLAQQVKVVIPDNLNEAGRAAKETRREQIRRRCGKVIPADSSLPLSERIAENIRRHREAVGIPQYVASQQSKLSYATWQKLESGTVPRIETLEKVCKYLQVSASDILGF